jgi:hypothetical protein
MAARRKPAPTRFKAPAEVETAWYDLPFEEQGMEIRRLIDSFKRSQGSRRAAYIRNLEAYEGRYMGGYSSHAYAETDGTAGYTRERLRLIRSAVSTAVANVYAPQKPIPQFQTLGATWDKRRRAQRLQRICEGVLNQPQGRWGNAWQLLIDNGSEVALQGVGPVMVMADKTMKKIVLKPFPHIDLYVDPTAGRNPRDLFAREPIGVDEAIGKYNLKGEKADLVMRAPAYEFYGMSRNMGRRATKVVELQYGWHLPSGPDAPGTWAIGVHGVTLDGDDWTAPQFPFLFPIWEPHRDGFWASGIGDEGGAMSTQCDDLDLRLHMREIIASGTKIFYEEGSVKPDDLAVNDALVGVAYQKGSPPPQQTNIVPFAPMELQYLETRVRMFWDAIGISQVSAAARREQGVSSGVAMRTLNDTKAGRQLVKAQRYEQIYPDLGRQIVWRLRELADDDPNFAVQWPGKNIIRSVSWKDADVEDNEFSTTVAPASALPHDPAGRQEMIQDLYRGGLISQETAKQLMGWPDLDAELEVENAETEYIDLLIERFLDADAKTWGMDDYEGPEGFIINKVGAMRRFISALWRARIDKASLVGAKEKAKAEFCIKLLVRWIKDCDKLMPGAAPAPGGAPGAGPPGMGAPPPGPMGIAPAGPQQLPGAPIAPLRPTGT